MKTIKKLINKINNRKGMSTIEVIFLIAVLLSLAIMFGYGMKTFVKGKIDTLNNGDYFDKVDPAKVNGSYQRNIKYVSISEGVNFKSIDEYSKINLTSRM